jgi:3-deoxy-D-manno-octulosonate 8-phosphate phosphatase (KDO 8-P phosphatase)
MPANRACAIYVTRLPGGQGAVREVCDLLVQLRTPSS